VLSVIKYLEERMSLDSIYIPGVEEVEIKSCVLHPLFPNKNVFYTGETSGFVGVKYGLCEHCIELTELNPKHQLVIEEELMEQTKKLKEEHEQQSR